ncbi:hypothetical protein D3C80_1918590 [compost metagenome]
MSHGRVTQIEGDLFYSLTLTNLGEYCERIIVSVESVSYPFEFETMLFDESRGFYVPTDSSITDIELDVVVRYVNRGGLEGRQSFVLREESDHNGGHISVIKKPFLS